jgi:hypothetical protein
MAGPAQAASPRYVQAELVSEVRTVQPGMPFWVGLRLQITPGWHVYWQNPGDSGERVRLTWQLPPGVTAGELQWPYPQRFPVGPLMNFGYENQVLLLSQITPPGGPQPRSNLGFAGAGQLVGVPERLHPRSDPRDLELTHCQFCPAQSSGDKGVCTGAGATSPACPLVSGLWG